MKKNNLIVLLGIISTGVFGQNKIESTGNVGIGTLTPSTLLELKGSGSKWLYINHGSSIGGLRIGSSDNTRINVLYRDKSTDLLTLRSGHDHGEIAFISGGNTTERMRIDSNGNVGIGTNSPEAKLHVLRNDVPNGHYLDQANIFESSESRFQILSADTQNAAAMLFLSSAPSSGNNKHWSFHHTGVSRNDRLEIGFGTSSTGGEFWDLNSKMTILTNGNVGIGTNSPKNKLSVNGTIWAKEVKVSMSDAADWVFEDYYELRSLEEVETFVKSNKHLPDIPSADEFRENDMNLGEMNNLLLQKMEEITLYMIDMNKQIQQLKAENIELKSKIKD